jgi:hypothetical protein
MAFAAYQMIAGSYLGLAFLRLADKSRLTEQVYCITKTVVRVNEPQ